MADETPQRANIEQPQQQRQTVSENVNRENAVRFALSALDPHNDDAQQGYAELCRRLRAALDVELAKGTQN